MYVRSLSLCTTIIHNTAQNSSNNFPLNPRLHDTTCCQTGCIVYTNILSVVQPVVSCKRGIILQPIVIAQTMSIGGEGSNCWKQFLQVA